MRLRLLTSSLALSLTALLLASLAARVDAPQVRAQGGAFVGLVIDFGDDRDIHQECIAYTPDMTGIDVLQSSEFGPGLVLQDYGVGLGLAVCMIEDVGCTIQEGCLDCEDDDGNPVYWSYSHLGPGDPDWVYSGLGAGSYRVISGTIEGWAFGVGDADDTTRGPAPDIRPSFEQVCAFELGTRTPTPSPTSSSATSTPGSPTPTSQPTDAPAGDPDQPFERPVATATARPRPTTPPDTGSEPAPTLTPVVVQTRAPTRVPQQPTQAAGAAPTAEPAQPSEAPPPPPTDPPPPPPTDPPPPTEILEPSAVPIEQTEAPPPTLPPALASAEAGLTATVPPPTAASSPTPTDAQLAAAATTVVPSQPTVPAPTEAAAGNAAEPPDSDDQGDFDPLPYLALLLILGGLGKVGYDALRRRREP